MHLLRVTIEHLKFMLWNSYAELVLWHLYRYMLYWHHTLKLVIQRHLGIFKVIV